MADGYGCDYCADEANRRYGHVEQVATHPVESAVLLRCPRCGWLYQVSVRETRAVSAAQAAHDFGWVDER